jgi:exonuclease III
MKIITWNCNGALRNKTAKLDTLNADILIIQECENPTNSTAKYLSWAGDYLWKGETKHKGIGVFAKNGHKIEKLDWNGSFKIEGLIADKNLTQWQTSDLRLFLPFRINNKLTALGVWTKGSDDEVFRYIGQLWKYLQIHHKELSNADTMILGDLNSNSIWDKKDRWWNHSSIIHNLKEVGLESIYHYQFNELQGKETIPTFFLQRNQEKAYHIDYAFLSQNLLPNAILEIGAKEDWLELSDHMPILIKINNT